ncbi:hypothetical protein P3T73_13660 [Kiritimatiellota bacterium B12222]|nr:hypothetical protein P3T73_13660 [Kiritimatiellota bacterium B12222]
MMKLILFALSFSFISIATPSIADVVADWRFEDSPSFLEDRSRSKILLKEAEGKVTQKATNTAMEDAAYFDGKSTLSAEVISPWGRNAMTVEMLFEAKDVAGEKTQYLMRMWEKTEAKKSWYIGIQDRKLCLFFSKDGKAAPLNFGPEISADKVYYIAVIVNGDKATVYVKNITDAQPTFKKEYSIIPNTLVTSEPPLPVGSRPQQSALFTGSIGRVRIHNEALNPISLIWGVE